MDLLHTFLFKFLPLCNGKANKLNFCEVFRLCEVQKPKKTFSCLVIFEEKAKIIKQCIWCKNSQV